MNNYNKRSLNTEVVLMKYKREREREREGGGKEEKETTFSILVILG